MQMGIKRYLLFLIAGLVFMLAPAYAWFVLGKNSLGEFLGAVLASGIFLTVGYAVNWIVGYRRWPIGVNVLYMLAAGLMGSILGYAFESTTIAWGMFVFFVGLFMVPRVMSDPRPAMTPLKAKLGGFYLLYSLFQLLLAVVLPSAWVPAFLTVLGTAVYTGMLVPYGHYISLAHRDRTLAAPVPITF